LVRVRSFARRAPMIRIQTCHLKHLLKIRGRCGMEPTRRGDLRWRLPSYDDRRHRAPGPCTAQRLPRRMRRPPGRRPRHRAAPRRACETPSGRARASGCVESNARCTRTASVRHRPRRTARTADELAAHSIAQISRASTPASVRTLAMSHTDEVIPGATFFMRCTARERVRDMPAGHAGPSVVESLLWRDEEDARGGSCPRAAPPVLGATRTCHERGACAAGGAAPLAATPPRAEDCRIRAMTRA
jgi:hypothetical protein